MMLGGGEGQQSDSGRAETAQVSLRIFTVSRSLTPPAVLQLFSSLYIYLIHVPISDS